MDPGEFTLKTWLEDGLVFLTEVLHLIANMYIQDQFDALGKNGVRLAGNLETQMPNPK